MDYAVDHPRRDLYFDDGYHHQRRVQKIMDPTLRANLQRILLRHEQGAHPDDVITAINQAYTDAGFYRTRVTLDDINPDAPEDIKLNLDIKGITVPRRYSDEVPF